MTVIEVNNLNVKYDQTNVLENISFHIEENEFIGIIGPNGGGKTTLVKTLLGLLKPSSGVYRVDSKATIGMYLR